MAPVATALAKVKDPDLAAWLDQDSGETREILVETVLPRRKVGSRPGTAAG